MKGRFNGNYCWLVSDALDVGKKNQIAGIY